MLIWYLIQRWRTKPCPSCSKRVRNGSPECSHCEAQLAWERRVVSLAR